MKMATAKTDQKNKQKNENVATEKLEFQAEVKQLMQLMNIRFIAIKKLCYAS